MVIIYPLPMKIEDTITIRKIRKYTLKADVKVSFLFFLIFSDFLNLICSFSRHDGRNLQIQNSHTKGQRKVKSAWVTGCFAGKILKFTLF